MSTPTPADLAKIIAAKRAQVDERPLKLLSKTEAPYAVSIAESIGLSIDEQIDTWTRSHGLETVKLWLSPGSSPADIIASWMRFRHVYVGAFPALVIEARISSIGAKAGSYLRSSGSSYAEALREVRWLLAEALRRQAATVKFHEPIMLIRVADLTAYAFDSLRAFVNEEDFIDDEKPRRSLARINRQVSRQAIMAARFSAGTTEKLESALQLLKELSDSTRDIPTLILRIEASLELYHATGEKDYLTDAATFINSRSISTHDWPAWHVIESEIWLNLADHASPAGRASFLSRADASFRALDGQELDLANEIRCAMFKALRNYVAASPTRRSSLRGVRLPFALRTARDLPDIVHEAADTIIDALRPAAERGQYQYREFLAELQSRIARQRAQDQALPLLRDAIRLRGPIASKEPLARTRDILAQAQDLLLLAEWTTSAGSRVEGLQLLVEEHRRSSTSSEPLVLIADEIEARGPSSGIVEETSPALANAIRTGDHTSIFAMAAARAFSNPGLRISGLGGRGETYTVDDFSGITGQTFVFKKTTRAGLIRDESRATLLSSEIQRANLAQAFGVIEHIGELSIDSTTPLANLVSIRRYVRGRTLRTALAENADSALPLLKKTSQFLGLIHAWEGKAASRKGSSRNQLKEKEVGRWLRKLAGSKKLELFKEWWELVETAPEFPRRDAHSLNWLVDDDDRVSAADLESTGYRPATYELAQLVDDYPVLSPRDWAGRESLLRNYLAAAEVPFTPQIFVTYRAATAARAVGLLTDSRSSDRQRNHGFDLLAHMAARDSSKALKSWCKSVLSAWRIKTGLVDPTRLVYIQPNDRVRISKAMAYHLRHDPAAQTAREGWMFVEDLADLLRAHGHNVTPQQLLVVAGALGEPRFQLDDQEIRATYGHSIARRSDYEIAAAPEWLYHATPASNLASVFEARAGLQPMGRQMVHLTTSPVRALRTAERHSTASYLLKVPGSELEGLVRAAEDTWLVPSVPADSLTVVTIAEMAALESED